MDYSQIPQLGRPVVNSARLRVGEPAAADEDRDGAPPGYERLFEDDLDDEQQQQGEQGGKNPDTRSSLTADEQRPVYSLDPEVSDRLDRRAVSGRLRPVDQVYRRALRGQQHYQEQAQKPNVFGPIPHYIVDDDAPEEERETDEP